MLSATARRSQIMDQMLTSKEIRNLVTYSKLKCPKKLNNTKLKKVPITIRNTEKLHVNRLQINQKYCKNSSLNLSKSSINQSEIL